MSIAVAVYAAVLFVLLTPGVVLSLPPGGTFLTKVVVHAVVFATVFYLTKGAVMRAVGGGY